MDNMYSIDTYYLYTIPGCIACEKIKKLLPSYTERVIDNPTLELGVQMLFKGRIYAPFVWHPKKGLFILSGEELQKIKLPGE